MDDSEYKYFISKIMNFEPVFSDEQLKKFNKILAKVVELANKEHFGENLSSSLVTSIKSEMPFVKLRIRDGGVDIYWLEEWFLNEKNLYIDDENNIKYNKSIIDIKLQMSD